MSKNELCELIKSMQNGDIYAREKIINHNIRLVIYQINKRFKNVKHEKNDLISIGLVGLMKAVNTFDLSKNINFATYASKCIDNEILMFIKKLKKEKYVDSLEKIIKYGKDDSEITLEELISDNTNIEEQYENNENYKIIRKIVSELPERDKGVVIMYFGFKNNRVYTQYEIAEKYNLSQPQISRILKNTLKKIKQELANQDIIELKKSEGINAKRSSYSKKNKNETTVNDSEKLKNETYNEQNSEISLFKVKKLK